MADVQIENGYTKIADEILERMAKIKLSPTQYRILFVVWRYTYGFNRKEHDLTLGFISIATGCDKRQIQRELKSLEQRHIIKQKVINGIGRKISFNKNHDEWDGETTIGETTIGETTIGEIDNGETINGRVGETVKATIGETDNQDIHSFKDNLKDITTEDDFFEPIINDSREDELKKAVDAYDQIHDIPLKPQDWPDMTRAVKEFGADHVIAVMKDKHAAASGTVKTFKYYLEPIKDRSRGAAKYKKQPTWQDHLNNFLLEGEE